MRKLQNYSIETDKLVWLEFSDGQHLRVAFNQISDHLAGPDLQRVRRAIKLRRDFLRHFPKAMALVAAAGLAAVAVVDSKAAANFWPASHPAVTAPARPAAAAVTATPSPAAAVVPSTAPTAPAGGAPAASALPSLPAIAPSPAWAVPAVPTVPPTPPLQGAPLTINRPLVKILDAVTSLLP